jgi:hypothetical protein
MNGKILILLIVVFVYVFGLAKSELNSFDVGFFFLLFDVAKKPPPLSKETS